MSRTTLDLWVGFFVVIGMGALLFLALKVGNLGAANGAQSYEVTGQFDNIGGLKIRAPVKSAGVVVGRVHQVAAFAVEGRVDDHPPRLALGVDLRHRPLAPEPDVQPADAHALEVLDTFDDR